MKVKQYVNRQINRLFINATYLKSRSKQILSSNTGTGFFDSGLKVLIAVVIGALLLAAMYALFANKIIPNVDQKTMDMFNYKG